MMSDDDPDGIDEVSGVMSAPEDIDLPEGMAASDDGIDLDCPDDYMPPPPPPDDIPPRGDEPGVDLTQVASAEPLNDTGNGRRFVIHFGAGILFVSQVGWFIWDGARWLRDAEIAKDLSPRIRKLVHQMTRLIEGEVDHLQPSPRDRRLLDEERKLRQRRVEIEREGVDGEAAQDELGAIGARLRAIDANLKTHKSLIGRRLTHAKNAGNSRVMSNMVDEAKVMLSRQVDEMDLGALLINTLSGVLRFTQVRSDHAQGMSGQSEVEILSHDRDQLLTKVCPVEYDPDAQCPRFMQFLAEIQPNIVMRQFLQRWFGLSMTGMAVQKLAFFHGGGANGKSVLVDLMARMAGDYSATAKIESLTGKNKKSGSDSQPDLIPLIGARFVRTSEPEEGERLQEGLVKALTGGEPMMIRDLFSGMITFQPYFKLTISGNHLPDIRGGDDGIWRRVMLVTFPVQIAEERRIPKGELDEILWAERSGILNWLIEGVLDYLNDGLQEPPEVLAATETYRKDSDPIGTFLADATDVTGYEGDFMTARELIEAFNFWIEERGETRWGNRTVSNRLKAKADTWRHPRTGKTFSPRKSGVTGYGGIRLDSLFASRMRDAENKSSGSGGWGPR